MSYITYKGQRYYVKDGDLRLSSLGISDISEIDGLETFTNLQGLHLRDNSKLEIKRLEKLTDLQALLN